MKNDLLQRSKQFAFGILTFSGSVKKSFENEVLLKQLIRSATSTAANYRASQKARSDAEFRAKICIVVEECDESLFWLEMLEESKLVIHDQISSLKTEATELLKIFSVIKAKVKQRTT